MIKGKRVLVTGGAGSIGSELTRQLVRAGNKVFILDYNETATFDLMCELKIPGRVGDIRDFTTVNDVFSDFRPQYVFHAGALKHVTPNETYPIEAIKTNVLGTHNVLQASNIYPVEKFIYVSTDKVVNAHSVMGMTKKLGEVMVCNRGDKHVAVRFGNVLGSRGSLIPIWERQLSQGQPITVTHPQMKRYFMTIEDACALVIEAASRKNDGGSVYILDMGAQYNILELAKGLLEKVGKGEENIRISGIRPGETLDEKLMTVEEEAVAEKDGSYWVIKHT